MYLLNIAIIDILDRPLSWQQGHMSPDGLILSIMQY